MAKTFSIFEAKTHLSELLRMVKGGQIITVTERGTPIAQVIPYSEVKENQLSHRLARLERAGLIDRRKSRSWNKSGIQRPGALKRFLRDRD